MALVQITKALRFHIEETQTWSNLQATYLKSTSEADFVEWVMGSLRAEMYERFGGGIGKLSNDVTINITDDEEDRIREWYNAQ